MVQNHLTDRRSPRWTAPGRFDPEAIARKGKVLQGRPPGNIHGAWKCCRAGQYSAGGSPRPFQANATSRREPESTKNLCGDEAVHRHWRWQGVLYLRTGKRLRKRFSEVVLTFRKLRPLFDARRQQTANQLIWRKSRPDEGAGFAF